MRSAEQIAAFIEDRIGHVYARPSMYGGTAEGVDLLLHYLLELWAFGFGREADYRDLSIQAHLEEGCGSACFPTHYHRDHPQASDQETTRYVVEQWKSISDRLGVPLRPQSLIETCLLDRPRE